jgi:hypothetical protein
MVVWGQPLSPPPWPARACCACIAAVVQSAFAALNGMGGGMRDRLYVVFVNDMGMEETGIGGWSGATATLSFVVCGHCRSWAVLVRMRGRGGGLPAPAHFPSGHPCLCTRARVAGCAAMPCWADAGGLFKELWTSLSAIAFNPAYGFFKVSGKGRLWAGGAALAVSCGEGLTFAPQHGAATGTHLAGCVFMVSHCRPQRRASCTPTPPRPLPRAWRTRSCLSS